MKVLIITGSYPPDKCGVGDYTANLAKSLINYTNLSIRILTSTGNEKSVIGSARLKIFPIIKNWRVSEFYKVIKIIWEESPDIVHIQYPTQGYQDRLLPWLLPVIAFAMRKKVVQTWHEIYTNPCDLRFLVKAIISGGLIVVRPEYKNKLNPKLQWVLKNKKFRFIRNASAIPCAQLNENEKAVVKKHYQKLQKRLIVFFGFIYEHKGTDLIFDIADPELDQIVIAGQFNKDDAYHQKISDLASNYPWTNKVTIAGFLQPDEIAKLLAVADAVVLPFRNGGGEWNTTIHSAVLQKTFVLTTSESAIRFDHKTNVYFAKIDDTHDMKSALNRYAGKPREYDSDIDRDEWQQIANEHYSLYKTLLMK